MIISIMGQNSFQTQLRGIDNWESFVRTVLLEKGCHEGVHNINHTKLTSWGKKWENVLWRLQNEDILVPFCRMFHSFNFRLVSRNFD
jgi:hypothetical protein